MSPTLFHLFTLLALVGLCSSSSSTLSHPKDTAFGLVVLDKAYHSLCDQGHTHPFKYPYPRACFQTSFHIADNIDHPHPAKLHGYIDASGKNFVLRPDAVVTLRNLEIHVMHTKEKPKKMQDRDCVDVIAYRLPKRNIKVRETWCPGQFLPINL